MTALDEVKKILADQLSLKVDEISADSKIVDDLGADSLDVVELLMILEDKKGIVVSDDEAAKLKTVGDVARIVEKLSSK